MGYRQAFRKAFPYTIPVLTGYLFIGIAFGVMFAEKGYSFLWAVLMSLLVYAGSGQYLAVNFFAPGVSLLQVVFLTLMVNIRHIFYGISMVDKYRDMGKGKPYLIFALTDETYSLVCRPDAPGGTPPRAYYFLVSLFDQCYWVAGSVLGGLVGSILPFDTTGVDFAMTALFTVIFVEQWEKADTHLPAVIGLAVSVCCLALFGADSFLIPAMIGITLCLFLLRGKIAGGGKADA